MTKTISGDGKLNRVFVDWRTPLAGPFGFNLETAICKARKEHRNKMRRETEQAMRDMGLVRVRGALGGVYWE